MRAAVLAVVVVALASTSASSDVRVRNLVHSANPSRTEVAKARPARTVRLRVVAHETAPTPAAVLPREAVVIDETNPVPLMRQMRSRIYANLPCAHTESLTFTPSVMAIPAADGSLVGVGMLARF